LLNCSACRLPPRGARRRLGFWSKPFPTQHPLYIGGHLRDMRFPGKLDVLLNLWQAAFGDRAAPRHDYSSRSATIRPASRASRRSDLAMVAGKPPPSLLPTVSRAIRSLATPARLKEIADERTARTRAYSGEMAEFRLKDRPRNADRTPITLSRIGLELEAALAPDTCYVCDVDSGKAMDPLMSFGGADKNYFSTGPNILGVGHGGGLRVKVARPDQPVVSVVGDGSFCFSGPQPLWSQARYRAPVMNIGLKQQKLPTNEAQPHLGFAAAANSDRARHDLLHRQPRCGLRQGSRRVRGGGRSRHRARRGQARDPARPARHRRRAALSPRYPHPARRHRGCQHLAIRSIRSPICGPGGCDGAACPVALRCCSACNRNRHAGPRPGRAAGWRRPRPPGDGVLACHPLNVIRSLREGAEGWKRHVYNMVTRGAQLNAREADMVVSLPRRQFRPHGAYDIGNAVALPTVVG